MITKLALQGISPAGGTPADFKKVIVDEIHRWTDVARSANIKAQ
jgi:tripartite-type tricarboxylate transporter receptor subunit TctC